MKQAQARPTVEYGAKALREKQLVELATALGISTVQVTAQVTAQVENVLRAAATGPRSREELQAAANMKHREHFRKAYVEPLVHAGWLERTIPDKPTSRLQRYRLTETGHAWLSGGAGQGTGTADDVPGLNREGGPNK
ncbi:MAG: hypothetical protein JW951_00300 [Lentisphaerae bacterium]|nr:hypothetical protein [Lentisphaerota bacterium]